MFGFLSLKIGLTSRKRKYNRDMPKPSGRAGRFRQRGHARRGNYPYPTAALSSGQSRKAFSRQAHHENQ